MGLLSWLAVGLAVGLASGLLTRWISPGPDGPVVAAILGMAGASIGGSLTGLVGGTGATGFNAWSLPVATVGAVALLLLHDVIARRIT